MTKSKKIPMIVQALARLARVRAYTARVYPHKSWAEREVFVRHILKTSYLRR